MAYEHRWKKCLCLVCAFGCAAAPKAMPSRTLPEAVAKPTPPTSSTVDAGSDAHRTHEHLADFVPATLGGVLRTSLVVGPSAEDLPTLPRSGDADVVFPPPPMGAVEGFYVSEEQSTTLLLVPSTVVPLYISKSAQNAFRTLSPGAEANVGSKVSCRVLELAGHRVERTYYLHDRLDGSAHVSSEARLSLEEELRVEVNVSRKMAASSAPSFDPDAAVALLREIDLAGLEAYVRTPAFEQSFRKPRF